MRLRQTVGGRRVDGLFLLLISLAASLLLLVAAIGRHGHHDSSPAAGLWVGVVGLLGFTVVGILILRPSPIVSASAAALTLLALNLLPAVKYTELYDSFDSILFLQLAVAIVGEGRVPSPDINFGYLDYPLLESLTASTATAVGSDAASIAKLLVPVVFCTLPFIILSLGEALDVGATAQRWGSVASLILYKNNFYLFMNLSLAILLIGMIMVALVNRTSPKPRLSWTIVLVLLSLALLLTHPFTSVVFLTYLVTLVVLHRVAIVTRVRRLAALWPSTDAGNIAAWFAAALFGWWIFRAQGVMEGVINNYLIATIVGKTDFFVPSPVTAGERHSFGQLAWLVLGYMPGTILLLLLGGLGLVLWWTRRSLTPAIRSRGAIPAVWFALSLVLVVGYLALPVSVLQWRLLTYALLVSPLFAAFLLDSAERRFNSRRGRAVLMIAVVSATGAGALEFYTNEAWPYGYVSNVVNSEYQAASMTFLGTEHLQGRFDPEQYVLTDLMTGYQLVGYGGLPLYPQLYRIVSEGEDSFERVLQGETVASQIPPTAAVTYIPLFDTHAGRMYGGLNDGTRTADQSGTIQRIMNEPNVSVIYDNGHSFIGALVGPSPQ